MKATVLKTAAFCIVLAIGCKAAWPTVADAIAARKCAADPGALASAVLPAATHPEIEPPDPWTGVLVTETADISPRFEGRLAKLLVRAGDVVKEGQALAELDASLQKHELAAAEAGVRASQAEAASAGIAASAAKERQQRRVGTVAVGTTELAIVSKEELSNAKYDWMAAATRAGAASAAASERRARLEQLRQMVAESVLRAPFDGVVAARYADPGTYVRLGSPLVRVVGRAGLRVRFAVPEADIAQLRVGTRVRVGWDAHELEAEVDRIAPEVESATSTLFVEAAVRVQTPDAGGALAGRVVVVRPLATTPKG